MNIKTGLGIGETILNALGVAVGAELMESVYLWLGIALLVINITSIVVRGVISIIQWYKKAKADGDISNEELEEAKNIVEDGAKDINTAINDFKKDKEEK